MRVDGPGQGTYETRFRADEPTHTALSELAAVFSVVERSLFARTRDGAVPASLKREFLREHRIPARLFNSVRVSLEGRVKARRAALLRQKETLESQVARAGKVVAKLERKGGLNAVHQKKRRLFLLRERLAGVVRDASKDAVRLCFGFRKLFRAQHELEANGYSSHEEWLRDWRSARNDSFFLMGSRDETAGNELCVATVREDGTLSLRLRLPDCLAERHGKYLVIDGLEFNHGHHQVLAALESSREYRSLHPGVKGGDIPKGLGQAVSYRFKLDAKGWRVFASVRKLEVPVATGLRLGAVGVDFNADHLAVTEVDSSGNWLRSFRVPLVTYGKSANQAATLTGDAVAKVMAYSKSVGKPVAFERLDFSGKRAELEGEAPERARMLSSLGYGRFREFLVSRGQREGVEVVAVNPAFSSIIGRVKYMKRYGLSAHQAAAMVLARRLLGCAEGILVEGSILLDSGERVAFRVPVRKRVKHVWTLWGALLGQLRPALAAQHRLGRPGGRFNPVRAGPYGPGLDGDQLGVSGRDSRTEPS